MSDITNLKSYILNSGSKLAFIKINEQNTSKIIPVLMLTGVTTSSATSEDYGWIWNNEAHGFIGTVDSYYSTKDHTINIDINKTYQQSELDIEHETNVAPYSNIDSPGDWLIISNEDLDSKKYELVYPRISIGSLNLKTDSGSLSVQLLTRGETNNNTPIELKPYQDYSILSRAISNEYVLTLNSNFLLKYLYNFYIRNNNITSLSTNKGLRVNYILSNADVAIYLDALEIAKENSQPKVSYEVKPTYLNKNEDLVSYSVGRLVRINDPELKFQNVRGYISGITLDLDSPSEDAFEIKNYKTKFEDLFSTITAQTEAMKKNTYNLDLLSEVFTTSGDITSDVLQSSIKKVDLNYAFNNGKLTIDEQNGIWGVSDSGVVAYRGGGIFTATEQNSDGSWKWNTGITPEGINADLITSGQLDTNLIKIYAGNHLRFQMNGDGIFAYKSWMDDINNGGSQLLRQQQESQVLLAEDSLDSKQYVVFNDQGLALIAEKGAKVLMNDKSQYYTVLSDEVIAESGNPELANQENIKRVQIGWDGLVLHNWQNERVFYADADTGNLYLKGTIDAIGGNIGAWHIDNSKIWIDSAINTVTNQYNSFVALNGGGNSSQTIYRGNGSSYTDSDGNVLTVNTAKYCFWAGNPNPELANFSIEKNGTIKATNGIIGGWTLQDGLFFNKNGIFLSPGGYNQSGTSTISYTSQAEEEGQASEETTITLNLNNYIIWSPSKAWSSNNNNLIKDSIKNPVFAVTRDGELVAQKINNCIPSWFTGYTVRSCSGSQIILVSPNGTENKIPFKSSSSQPSGGGSSSDGHSINLNITRDGNGAWIVVTCGSARREFGAHLVANAYNVQIQVNGSYYGSVSR